MEIMIQEPWHSQTQELESAKLKWY
uniref:Uncharacterized protein n=1 Tax=Rhizophora mucronata TaxID=61149 RepID=A0A2P2P0J3_RHIMU